MQINSHKRSIELRYIKAKLEHIEEGDESPLFDSEEVTVDDILTYAKVVFWKE